MFYSSLEQELVYGAHSVPWSDESVSVCMSGQHGCGVCMGTSHCCPRDQGLGALVCGPRRKTRTCSLVSTPGQAGRWAQLSPVASRRSPPNPMSLVGVGCLGLQEWVGLPFWKEYFLARGPPCSHLATQAPFSAPSVSWLAQVFLPVALSRTRVPGSPFYHECGISHLRKFKMSVSSKQRGVVSG